MPEAFDEDEDTASEESELLTEPCLISLIVVFDHGPEPPLWFVFITLTRGENLTCLLSSGLVFSSKPSPQSLSQSTTESRVDTS